MKEAHAETCECGRMEAGGCGCGCGGHGMRNFLTKEEKLQMLREYGKALEAEAKGVAERIKELEKSK